MIESLVAQIGPWTWMVVGLILLVAELLIPGIFLIWIGVAAIIVGALSLALWGSSFWSWQVQVIVFLVLSVASAFVGRALMGRQNVSDQPLLNRRREQLVGKTATLEEAIVNGSGRIRIDDTVWRVSGPDLKAGTRVRVAAATSNELIVEEAS